MNEEQVRQIASSVYDNLDTQYGVAKVPAHSHNGVDTNNIPLSSISNFFPAVTTVPTTTPTQFGQYISTDTTNGQLWTYDNTNKRWRYSSGHKSVVSITTASSYTLNTDSYNALSITALASTINTISASGTPSNFDSLIIRIKDNGTSQTVAWDATKFVSQGIVLPTATVAGKTMTIGFLYNSVSSVFGAVAYVHD